MYCRTCQKLTLAKIVTPIGSLQQRYARCFILSIFKYSFLHVRWSDYWCVRIIIVSASNLFMFNILTATWLFSLVWTSSLSCCIDATAETGMDYTPYVLPEIHVVAESAQHARKSPQPTEQLHNITNEAQPNFASNSQNQSTRAFEQISQANLSQPATAIESTAQSERLNEPTAQPATQNENSAPGIPSVETTSHSAPANEPRLQSTLPTEEAWGSHMSEHPQQPGPSGGDWNEQTQDVILLEDVPDRPTDAEIIAQENLIRYAYSFLHQSRSCMIFHLPVFAPFPHMEHFNSTTAFITSLLAACRKYLTFELKLSPWNSFACHWLVTQWIWRRVEANQEDEY